jgi:anti-sigma-K factor RskA
VKYSNEQLRDALAARYAVGTLQGAARRRFERSLRESPALRRHVAQWNERLAPLNSAIEPVQPPAQVWHAIERRLGARRGRGLAFVWDSLAFWRGSALAGMVAALALAVSLALLSPVRVSNMIVVVMSDDKASPAMTVSWQAHDRGDRNLRIRVLGHTSMAPGTAWELWMLPAPDAKPVSLGLITAHETQQLTVPRELAAAIDAAQGMAMSVEPEGGSPTGLPTGPVIYSGASARL